jgi:hypothetical protein
MSLISTASVWTNDDTPKKRIPTLRKTLKKQPTYTNNIGDEYISDGQNVAAATVATAATTNMEETQKTIENRNLRINEIIDKFNGNNEEGGLSDFKPLPNTILNSKKPDNAEYDRRNTSSTNFSSNNMNLANLSNYNKSYEPPVNFKNKPYYKNFGIGDDVDNKLMEKINYMVHMMEDMQGEKTNNITEEFILYSLLGIFMIFMVDSFSKTTRYIR